MDFGIIDVKVPVKPGIINGTKITIERGKHTIGMRTNSRQNKSPHRFLLLEENLRALLDGSIKWVLEKDIGSFAVVKCCGKTLLIKFTWLTDAGLNRVVGYEEMVWIDKDVIRKMLESDEGCTIKVLSVEKREKTTFDFSCASEVLRNIIDSRKIKRAFIKAISKSFQWPGDTVRFFWDSKHSFFFRADGTWPISGGFILHQSNDQHKSVYYGVHT